MIPARLKICGIYVNSILAKTEATLAGFDEAIILNHDGHVCEGSGENLFLIADGKTGPISAQLQKMYFDIVVGRNPKYLHWCTPASPRPVAV